MPFTGVYLSIQYSSLSADHFQFLASGAEYSTTINAAAVHDLGTGSYSFLAAGAIPFALGTSTELSGEAVAFKSNTLQLSVDGAVAALVRKAIDTSLGKRTVLQSGCSSSQSSSTRTALTNCASLARAAASAASSGSATKFSEYFKTTSASTRSVVAARLTAVANQCASTTSGATRYYCTDVYGKFSTS